MIEKLKVLQRVKETREFAALRLMRAKKNELQEANRVRAENERSFLESKQTLPVREDGIYEDILNKVVNLDLLDIVGERVSTFTCATERLSKISINRCASKKK